MHGKTEQQPHHDVVNPARDLEPSKQRRPAAKPRHEVAHVGAGAAHDQSGSDRQEYSPNTSE